tara:strand:+ start:164 stop:370 length:207 start_codon:yes stop_codon:yes gene_type:complete
MMDLKEVRQEELYEQFQEWLNQCPIKITDYTDNVTDFAVDFSLEVDEELETVSDNINKPEVFIPNFHD